MRMLQRGILYRQSDQKFQEIFMSSKKFLKNRREFPEFEKNSRENPELEKKLWKNSREIYEIEEILEKILSSRKL